MKMRQEAPTKSMQQVFKLLANSLFGKMIESMLKRMECKFELTKEQFLRHASSVLFKGYKIINEDFTVTFHRKKSIMLTQPIAVGFSILELSKLIMQRLYYLVLKPKLDPLKVMMTDTDSFLVLIKNNDPISVVQAITAKMDLSNYPLNHVLYNNEKKFVIGYLKNEMPIRSIVRFVGIRSKTYGFEHVLLAERKHFSSWEDYQAEVEKSEKKKRVQFDLRAKGIGRTGKNSLTFQDFASVLNAKKSVSVTVTQLQSKSHVIRLIEGQKQAFSSFDDKRFLLCSVHSVPYGSCLIGESEALPSKCYFCHYKSDTF